MTTLIAYHEPDGPIWIGSDRQRTQNDIVQSLASVKWRTRDPSWAFSSCGTPSVADIAYALSEQAPLRNDPQKLVNRLMKRIEAMGWVANCQDGQPPYREAGAMLVASGALYHVDLGKGWLSPVPPGQLQAEGSGRELAIGAFHAQEGVHAKARMDTALRVAIRFDVYSGGEPFIHKL